MNSETILVGDIGGTNARFALADATVSGFKNELTLTCADFRSPIDAIRHYLGKAGASDPTTICLAAAGPVVDGNIDVTNNHWCLSAEALRRELNAARVKLLNDFEAIAWSLPLLEPSDLETIGEVSPRALTAGSFSIAVVGPGTGLGTGGLYKRDGRFVPIVGEGGHVGFAPGSRVQLAVLEFLREKFESVSIERLLSGPGIENLYEAVASLQGIECEVPSAARIFATAEQGADPVATEAIRLFFEVLGQVAGDVALLLGATDGLYLAGGIVKRYPQMLHASEFRRAFDDKGKHRSMMESIPTTLITGVEPGLSGATHCALKLSGLG